MVEAKRNVELPKPHFGAAENPIEMMKHEHENEGDRFEKNCPTFKSIYTFRCL